MMSQHSARPARAALGVLLLMLTSCTSDGVLTKPQRIDLVAAKRRWALTAPSAYQVTVTHGCFCPQELNHPVIVTVRNGQVESRRYADSGLDVDPRFAGAFPTIDGLFAIIEGAIFEGAEQVDVRYDVTYGFPLSVSLDRSAARADDEDYFGMQDFQAR